MKLPFQAGDVVMVCEHLYHASSCRVSPKVDFKSARIRHNDPAARFTREDGTTGICNWEVVCKSCVARDPESHDTNLVECSYRDGRLLTADFAGDRR